MQRYVQAPFLKGNMVGLQLGVIVDLASDVVFRMLSGGLQMLLR